MARRTNATGYDPHSSDPGNPWRRDLAVVWSKYKCERN